MDKYDKIGAAAGIGLIAIFTPLILIADHNQRIDTFNNGYCFAMGGELLSEDICAKDGQIIPIPPRP